MNTIIITSPKITDAEDIARVHVKTWQHAYKGLMPEEFLQQLDQSKWALSWEDRIKNPKPKTKDLIAKVDDKIAGFCSVGFSRDDDTTDTNGEIRAIYVDPTHQGLGIGSKLQKAGLAWLKNNGYTSATLWVLTTNVKSIDWYTAHGWINEGKVKIDKRQNYDLHETRLKIFL